MSQSFELNPIKEAIEDFKAGKFVIVVDDEDRENEGDFITATEPITPGRVNFMMRYGRGVPCTPITEDRAIQPKFNVQVHENTSLYETPFTVTVDLVGRGCTTGVSMHDRAMAVKALADPNIKPTDLVRPGHVNLLRARNRGVLRRADHTEAAIDLAHLAGPQPAGVLIGVINEDGTMARLPQLTEIAKQWNMKIVSIRDLIVYRLKTDCIAGGGVGAKLPTEWGVFDVIPSRQRSNGLEHIALIRGDILTNRSTPVRMHSSCAAGDIFDNLRCECGEQLHKAMKIIEQGGVDVIVCLDQEGCGIGLMNKVKTYKLQDEELGTADANLHLRRKVDRRDYGVDAQIFHAIDVAGMCLMTSGPVRRVGLEAYGLKAMEAVPLGIEFSQYSTHCLHTKKVHMGHDLHNVK